MISPSTMLTTSAAKLASGTFLSDGFAAIRNIFSSSEQAPATNHSPVSTRENVSNVRSSAEDIFSDSWRLLFNGGPSARQQQKKVAKKEIAEYRLTENLFEVVPLLTELLQENSADINDEACALTVKASLEQLSNSLPVNLSVFNRQFFNKAFDLKFQLETNTEFEAEDVLFSQIEHLHETCQEYLVGHCSGQENLESVFDLVAMKKEFIQVQRTLLQLKKMAEIDNEFDCSTFIGYIGELLNPFDNILLSLESTANELLKKINIYSKPYADRIINLLSDWQEYAGYHQSPNKKTRALLHNLYQKIQPLITSGFLSTTTENIDQQTALQLVELYDYLTKIEPLLSDVTEGHIAIFIPELNSAITEFRQRFWGDYNYIVHLHLGASRPQLNELHDNLVYLKQKYPALINDKIKVTSSDILRELFNEQNWRLNESSIFPAAAITKIEEPLCMESIPTILSSYSDNIAVTIHALLANLSQTVKLLEEQSITLSPLHHSRLITIFGELKNCYLTEERNCCISDLLDISMSLPSLNTLTMLFAEIKEQTIGLPVQWLFLTEDLFAINSHLQAVINKNLEETIPHNFDATDLAVALQGLVCNILSRNEYIVLAMHNSAWSTFFQATNTLVEQQRAVDVSSNNKLLSWKRYLDRFAEFMRECTSERVSHPALIAPLERVLLQQLMPIINLLQQPISQQVKATEKQLIALTDQLQTVQRRHGDLANNVLERCGNGATALRQLMSPPNRSTNIIHKLDSDLFSEKESANQFKLLAESYQKEILSIQQGSISQMVEYLYSDNGMSSFVISADLCRLLEIEKELSDFDLKMLPANVLQLRNQFAQQTSPWPDKIKNALIMKRRDVQFDCMELFNNAQLLQERLHFILEQIKNDNECNIFSLPFAKRYILNSMHISADHEIALPNEILQQLGELLILAVEKHGTYFIEHSDILISSATAILPQKDNLVEGGMEIMQLPQWLIKLFSLPMSKSSLLSTISTAKQKLKFAQRQQCLQHLHPLQSAAHIEQVIADSKPQPSVDFDLEQVIAYHLAAAAGDFVEDKQKLLATATGAGVLMFANQSVSQMSRRFASVTPQQALVAKAKTAASKIKFAVSQTPLRHLSPVPVWQFVHQHFDKAKDALYSALFFNSLVQEALDEAALDELLIHHPNFIAKANLDLLPQMPVGALNLLISLADEKLAPFSTQYQFDDLFIYDDLIGIVKKEPLSCEESKIADIYMLHYLARKHLATRNWSFQQ